jgi:hypothetical protein
VRAGRTSAPGLLAAAIAVGLLFAACAEPGRWQKPGGNADDWERDQSSCRYRARKLVDQEFRARPPERDSSLIGGPSALDRDMAQFDARRRERRLFENCMKNLGYALEATPKK